MFSFFVFFFLIWFGSIWFVLNTTHLFDVIAVLLGLLFVAFGLLLEQGLKTASKHYKFRHTIYGIRFTNYDMWCKRIGFCFFQEFGVWCWVVVVVVVVWCGINDWKFRDSMYVYIEIDVCTSIVLTWLWGNEITLDTRHYRDGMNYYEYFEKIPKYQLRRITWVMRVPEVRPCTFCSSQSVCLWSVWSVAKLYD